MKLPRWFFPADSGTNFLQGSPNFAVLLVRPEYCLEGTHFDYFPENSLEGSGDQKTDFKEAGFLISERGANVF